MAQRAALAERIRTTTITVAYPSAMENGTDSDDTIIPELMQDMISDVKHDRSSICLVDNMRTVWDQRMDDADSDGDLVDIFGEEGIVRPWMRVLSPWKSAWYEMTMDHLLSRSGAFAGLRAGVAVQRIAVSEINMAMNNDRFLGPAAFGILELMKNKDFKGNWMLNFASIDDIHWVQVQATFWEVPATGGIDFNLVAAGIHFVLMDKDGKLIGDHWTSYAEDAMSRIFEIDSDLLDMSALCKDMMLGIDGVAMLTNGFANVKNVVIEEQKLPHKVWKKRRKKLGIDPARFSIVKIKPTSGGGSGTGDGLMAIHPVRGHFKHYPNGLFGNPKMAGTFWHEAHIRGNPEMGTKESEWKM